MSICKTASEVIDKYPQAEKISPAFERVTMFSWNDMLLLKDEIKRLKEYEWMYEDLCK